MDGFLAAPLALSNCFFLSVMRQSIVKNNWTCATKRIKIRRMENSTLAIGPVSIMRAGSVVIIKHDSGAMCEITVEKLLRWALRQLRESIR